MGDVSLQDQAGGPGGGDAAKGGEAALGDAFEGGDKPAEGGEAPAEGGDKPAEGEAPAGDAPAGDAPAEAPAK